MDIECKALENWRVCRSALTAVIRNYLAACADLRLACSQVQCPLGTRREVEPVQLAIDAELASLASEESDLAKARASLLAIRNTSSTLAPVHTLPPEILARIFLIARYPLHYYFKDGSDLAPVHTFAQVSSYWRSTTINLPYLWTHIRITPAQTSYEYAALFLHRSNGLPIYLDIRSEEVVEQWDDYPAQPQWEKFLASASQQVHTLNLYDSFRLPETLLYEAIRLLLSHGSPGIMKALRIRRPEAEELGNLEPLLSANRSGDVLHSITVLHLDDVSIPWTSMIFHNLVDLQLEFATANEGEISMLQLANILAASPELVILKLQEMMITTSDNWSIEKVVRPAHLELLYLKHLTYDSWVALPLILSLSDCPGTLEVGIHDYGGNPPEISQLVQNFLHGARVKTLGIFLLGRDDNPQWALSLSTVIPSLENLILSHCNLLNLHGPERTVDKPEISANTTTRLPHLFLVSGSFDLDKLKLVISLYGVKNLHLVGRPSQYMLENGPPKDELKAALLETFSDLTCIASAEDTTLFWPCHTMFN
ncbi:hypothetical protein FRC09_000893 [Ceratobasidium sp. 395]|nr:hypothetical protein FRC09_000893 [Ceratobasidium sp. 395]